MPCFVVDTRYDSDRDLLQRVRPPHRDYLKRLAEQGTLLAAGPWADDTGGMVVLRVADRAELYRVLAEDPYTTEGVATERVIREWNPTIGQLSAQ